MGRPKLLLPWGKHSVIEQVLSVWQTGGVNEVLVVCRRSQTELVALCERAGANVVAPANDPPEMKHSVEHALREIALQWAPTEADCWLLAPADLPGLSPTVIAQLLAARTQQPHEVLLPVHQGRRGHPVLFPWEYAEQVGQLAEGEGVNALLGRLPLLEIPAGEEALARDIDTPEEYRRLREQ